MLALICGVLFVVTGIAFGLVALELLRMRKALLETLDLVGKLIDGYGDLTVAAATKGGANE